MSSMLLHQSFETDQRLEVVFENEDLPAIYAVKLEDKLWLDTQLLPPGSGLDKIIVAAHYKMLKAHLAKHRKTSLADAYAFSADARRLGFTLRVTCSISQDKQPTLDVLYCRQVNHIVLPDIESITSTDKIAAEVAMDFWRLESKRLRFA